MLSSRNVLEEAPAGAGCFAVSNGAPAHVSCSRKSGLTRWMQSRGKRRQIPPRVAKSTRYVSCSWIPEGKAGRSGPKRVCKVQRGKSMLSVLRPSEGRLHRSDRAQRTQPELLVQTAGSGAIRQETLRPTQACERSACLRRPRSRYPSHAAQDRVWSFLQHVERQLRRQPPSRLSIVHLFGMALSQDPY